MRKIIISLLFLSQSAYSYHFCKGTIENVWVEADGDTYINGSWAGHTQICKINGDWKGVNAEVCKAWLSMAQIAHSTGGNVVVRYSDDAIPSCSEIPAYNAAPIPNYLLLEN